MAGISYRYLVYCHKCKGFHASDTRGRPISKIGKAHRRHLTGRGISK